MLTYGKSYKVTKRSGDIGVYRSGKLVGTHPEVGYSIQVFGVCSALAGTELAAHAVAEIYKDVPSHKRLWVLTEAEYDEHRRVLRENLDELLAKFPYSAEEKASVDEQNEKYAKVIEEGERNVKLKLMNVSRHEYITERPPLARPAQFPGHEQEDAAPGMRR